MPHPLKTTQNGTQQFRSALLNRYRRIRWILPLLLIPVWIPTDFLVSTRINPLSPEALYWIWDRSFLNPNAEGLNDSDPENEPLISLVPIIHTTPTHQILHAKTRIKVSITDPAGDLEKYRFMVSYNGRDVSKRFLKRARFFNHPSEHRIEIEIPSVRLSPLSVHDLVFYYRSSSGRVARTRLPPPACPLLHTIDVLNTGEFSPSGKLLRTIKQAARSRNVNPAYLTALVAQESSFNPKRVSWAKAIGLTQITTNAEKEIAPKFPHWPRYKHTEHLNARSIHLLIKASVMNENNEWRLNPGMSIEGGASFLIDMAARWSSAESLQWLSTLSKDPEDLISRLVLASYHSGFNRVQRAVRTYGVDWINAPDLGEAKRYINQIFSMCSSFGEPPSPVIEDLLLAAQNR